MGRHTYQTRAADAAGPDDYPTPPWATRAFLTHVLPQDLTDKTCWEPAANRGYMVRPLRERFGTVIASDFVDYGVGFSVVDFLDGPVPDNVDWIITNPPFNKAEEFIFRAFSIAREGVAMFVRNAFAEGDGRYERLFALTPPTLIAQYSSRVNIMRGVAQKKTGSMVPYSWFVWQARKTAAKDTRFMWIPPCRKEMEREEDYA